MCIKYNIYLKLLYIIVNKICNSFRLTPGSGEHNFFVRQMSKNNYYYTVLPVQHNGHIGRSRRDFYYPVPTRKICFLQVYNRRYYYYYYYEVVVRGFLANDRKLNVKMKQFRVVWSYKTGKAYHCIGRINVLQRVNTSYSHNILFIIIIITWSVYYNIWLGKKSKQPFTVRLPFRPPTFILFTQYKAGKQSDYLNVNTNHFS